MMKLTTVVALGLLTIVPSGADAGQAPRARSGAAAAERFEVTSIKAVRPTLANTVAALKKKDIDGAKAAFEDYDSAWNGIEVYINTRSRPMYDELERNLQAKITEGLNAPNPDVASLTSMAESMLAKYDEAIRMVESSVRRCGEAADRSSVAARSQSSTEGRQSSQSAQVVLDLR